MTCQVPACEAPATSVLLAKPSGMRLRPPEELEIHFCAEDARRYAAMGYQQPMGSHQQERLV